MGKAILLSYGSTLDLDLGLGASVCSHAGLAAHNELPKHQTQNNRTPLI